MRPLLLVAACAAVFSCSPKEKRETRLELRRTGDAVKKELKNDARFMKEQALKARAETQKGVKELKKKLNSDEKEKPAQQ